MRVVGGELRIDPLARVEQPPGVGEIARVRRRLAGEDRKVRQPPLLRLLDLGVPVGALDQPHHDPPVEPPRQRVQPVDHRARRAGRRPAPPPRSRPSRPARGSAQQRLDHVERQVQPLRLLGVDVEADPRPRRRPRQLARPRHQHLASPRRGASTRSADAAPTASPRSPGSPPRRRVARAADRRDRPRVGRGIAQRVRRRCAPPRRACRRSRCSPSPPAPRARSIAAPMVSPSTNCAPHQLHRPPDRGAHHRLAQPPDHARAAPPPAARARRRARGR